MFVCRCEVVWLIFTSLSFCFCDCGTSSFSSSSRGWRGLCGFFFSFSLNENLPRSTPPILSNLSVVCVVTFLELPRACLISSTSWSFSSSCLSLCSSSSRRWSISLSFSSISFLRCLSTSISRLSDSFSLFSYLFSSPSDCGCCEETSTSTSFNIDLAEITFLDIIGRGSFGVVHKFVFEFSC